MMKISWILVNPRKKQAKWLKKEAAAKWLIPIGFFQYKPYCYFPPGRALPPGVPEGAGWCLVALWV